MPRQRSEPRALWVVLVLACVLGAGGIGYAAGHSGGADVSKAKAQGTRAGRTSGAAAGARDGYRAGLDAGRKAGYDKAFKAASSAAAKRGGP
jgi:hypothetical protein